MQEDVCLPFFLTSIELGMWPRTPCHEVWSSQCWIWNVCHGFPFFALRCPLVSLSYLPRAAVTAFPYGGVLAGTLENASFWELKTDFCHKPHVLSLEPGGFVDFQTESSTRHCLVTYRPGEF